MPIRPALPELLARAPEEGRMELRKPYETRPQLRRIDRTTSLVKTRSIEIFEEYDDLVPLPRDRQTLRHPRPSLTSPSEVLIPSRFHLIGFQLARMRTIRVPPARMLRRGGRRNMFHNHARPVRPFESIPPDRAIPAPQTLQHTHLPTPGRPRHLNNQFLYLKCHPTPACSRPTNCQSRRQNEGRDRSAQLAGETWVTVAFWRTRLQH